LQARLQRQWDKGFGKILECVESDEGMAGTYVQERTLLPADWQNRKHLRSQEKSQQTWPQGCLCWCKRVLLDTTAEHA